MFWSFGAHQAVADASPFMAVAGATSQPVGHYEFCRNHSSECVAHTTRDRRVDLDEGRWGELVAVNDHVNATIIAATDMEIFGRPEVWAYPHTHGDCEDYALLKRRMLIERGWPEGALLMTVVRKADGEGHAVLTVRTDRGDLVLDNLEAQILVWSRTEYRYVKRQSKFDAGRWVAIADERPVLVGSVGN